MYECIVYSYVTYLSLSISCKIKSLWYTFNSHVNFQWIITKHVNISVWEKWFSDIYAAKLECRNSLKSLQSFIMIRNDMNLCRCTDLPSQIPVLVTALSIFSQFLLSKKKKKKKLVWKISYREKALMNFHHDAPNSHVPAINLLELLVHPLLITSYHSR